MTIEPPLDWTRFTSLADGDGGVADLIAFYVEYSATELQRLRSALASGSVCDVEAAAHRLAGSSATAGAMRVAAPLAQIEEAAHAGSLDEAEARLRQAEAAFADIREFLASRLEEGTRP